jgi:hypothetical protein
MVFTAAITAPMAETSAVKNLIHSITLDMAFPPKLKKFCSSTLSGGNADILGHWSI